MSLGWLTRGWPAAAVVAAAGAAYVWRDPLDAVRVWLAVVAAALWLVVLAGALHDADALPAFVRARWLRRALDRIIARHNASAPSRSAPDRTALAALAATLRAHVVGQPQACDDIAELVRAGMAKTRRSGPVGVFLLIGPPNIGKTWLAQTVDRALYGEGTSCVVELHHYDATGAAANLFGEARTHASAGTRGILVDALRERPGRVVVLAEFHKAGADVQQRLLRACSDGHLPDPVGGANISIRDAVFFLTMSDIPRDLQQQAAAWRNRPDHGSGNWKQALPGVFPAPLLARIDRVVAFHPMSLHDLSRITARRLETFIGEFDLDVETIDAQLLHGAILQSHSPSGDPHDTAHRLRQQLATPLVDLKNSGVRRVRLVERHGAIAVVPA